MKKWIPVLLIFSLLLTLPGVALAEEGEVEEAVTSQEEIHTEEPVVEEPVVEEPEAEEPTSEPMVSETEETSTEAPDTEEVAAETTEAKDESSEETHVKETVPLFTSPTPAPSGLNADINNTVVHHTAFTGISVDVENTYPGMNQAYRYGYAPQVSGGRISLLVPFLSETELYGQQLRVTLEKGAEPDLLAAEPGTVTVPLSLQLINGTATAQSVYYLSLDLPLASTRTNGDHPLRLNVEGNDSTGALFSDSFTVYFTVTDGVDPSAVAVEETADRPSAEASTAVSTEETATDESTTEAQATEEDSTQEVPSESGATQEVNTETATTQTPADETTTPQEESPAPTAAPAEDSEEEQSSGMGLPVTNPSASTPEGTDNQLGSSGDQQAETPAPTPSTEDSSNLNTDVNETVVHNTIPTGVTIDTDNIYPGMDKAYRDGYMPKVENGVATIVLPLVASGELHENKLTVTPDLGGGSGPFVISNIQMTVRPSQRKINGTASTKELYYVTLELPLKSGRTNGVYPVSIQVEGYDVDLNPLRDTFTLYVTITDGKSAEPAPVYVEIPTAEPVVLISSCRMEPRRIMAGEPFTLEFTLKNSLETKLVKNLLVTVSVGSNQINLEEDSSVFQLEGIEKGGTTTLTLHLSTDASIPAGKYNISLSMAYDSNKSLHLSSSGSVLVEVRQPVSVELVLPQIPGSVTAGETIPLSFQVINMGRDSINNARCVIEGFGLLPANTGYIGTMAAGSSANTDISLFIGSKTMSEGYELDEKYGLTSGTVLLIYEDSYGEEYTESFPFYTEIQAPVILTQAEVEAQQQREEKQQAAEEAKEQARAGQWWVSAAILGTLAVAGSAVLVLRARRNRYGSRRR